ncbi:MAG: HAD family hydrolase [Dehalococcoidia bacterium]
MSIRGVLFDWDGTLVRDDTVRIVQPCDAVAAYARETLALNVDAPALERAWQAVMPEYVPGETILTPHISSLLGSAFTWLGLAVSAGEVEACSQRFYDDARALLASLRVRGYAVGVVTNTIFPAHLLWPNLSRLGIAGYVDSLVTSVDVGFGKPHPAPYQRALADLKLQPHEAIFVGDREETDIAGARAAGMRAVLLERTGRARDRSGFLVVERLAGLNDILGDGPVS